MTRIVRRRVRNIRDSSTYIRTEEGPKSSSDQINYHNKSISALETQLSKRSLAFSSDSCHIVIDGVAEYYKFQSYYKSAFDEEDNVNGYRFNIVGVK